MKNKKKYPKGMLYLTYGDYKEHKRMQKEHNDKLREEQSNKVSDREVNNEKADDATTVEPKLGKCQITNYFYCV